MSEHTSTPEPESAAPRENRISGIVGQTAADTYLAMTTFAEEQLTARLRDSAITVDKAELQRLLAEVTEIVTSKDAQGRARARGQGDRKSNRPGDESLLS